ncbi:MAG: VOC family protein [Candidatus Nanopelagicales bacterium]|jgi:catechol 2,3-dioxygenase-like lactoylglutathione lyase family enzyme|nr:VOC family protein [Candidatus Nanopelagicales bacterium]MCU0298171.1 VOC family protein [Candidatus Nanopelagicales bacterium]
MAVLRMDNVAIVVEDLDAAIAFFAELGLQLQGRSPIEGAFADHAVGLSGVRSEIAMMRTPDGHGRLELTKYLHPRMIPATPVPANTQGLHRIMFAVDDIDDTIERLRAHGGRVLDRVAQYEDLYRLCYMRGPSGIIVALAEEIS